MRTLEGGLRIDAEDAGDWQLLGWITRDAVGCDESLAARLGGMITDEDLADDWHELIVPDLEAAFGAALSQVTSEIESARLEAAGGEGSLWIKRDQAQAWYSALNQARLAIEEQFRFGPSERIDPIGLPQDEQSAFLRSQFYCALQTLLLELVMT